jgi:MFS family permease
LEKSPQEIKRTVRTFAAASFLNDFGSDIIYPVWPLFVTQVLKANMAALGLLDGLGEALVSLSQKAFIWTGYLLGGLSRLGYASAAVWQHLIPFRILDRLGKMRGAPRDALVADISTDGNRGRHFGLMRAMDNLGAALGVVTCILLVKTLGYRHLFALAAIPSMAAAALILTRIKERPSANRIFKGMSLRHADRNLTLYLGLNGVFALGAFSYSFLLIYAREAGFGAGFVPVLYLIFTVSAALLSLPFGRLSDRIGRKALLYVAFGFWAAVCAGVVAVRGPAAVIGIFVLYGLHKAALEPVQRTLVTELCPPQYRASTLGAFQLVVGLCALPASLLAGWLWDTLGRFVPFFVSLGLTGLAAVLLLFVKAKRTEAAPAG